MKKINECLNDSFEHKYILPFFWQHGDDHALLAEELDAIESCGIKEFCAESRIHDDFCREKWWEDFGYLLAEAERRDMKVWLLDDKQFPTGYANHYIEEHKELRKKLILTCYRDIISDGDEMALIPPDEVRNNLSSCISMRAYCRYENDGRILEDVSYDLSSDIRNNLIYCKLPEGYYRVHYVYETDKSVKEKINYIDMLSEESCRAMIYAVYEPHFEHFGKYFGRTFKGFFSDEPSFGNEVASYQSKLGKEDMPIPWSDALPDIIADNAGITKERVLELLPALWHEIKGGTALIRQYYMDAVTKLYQKNFTELLGNWCREHSVMYIGHVIEDMNTHQRLGYGSGHYFRATGAQDMAGIDVVLHQILPGFTDSEHTLPVCGKIGAAEFFEYMLAKLCISQAQLTPAMKGRAMCEIFGAYGWAEGVPTMKRLADSMLVNGINRFVPHAFDTHYPNPDCPPHFYIRGKNPQFPYFIRLMQYMQRASHLLDGGTHEADIALFYNAEGEWSGGKNMLTQHPAKILTRCHVDFEIVWEDIVCRGHSENNTAVIGNKKFRMLILPYAEYLPQKLLHAINCFAENGVPVLFVGGKPKYTCEGVEARPLLMACRVITEDELADEVKKYSLTRIKTDGDYPLIRYYSYRNTEGRVWMFKNDNIFSTADLYVDLGTHGELRLYDCWNNKLYIPETNENSVRIRLGKGDSCFVVESSEPAEKAIYPDGGTEVLFTDGFDISVKESGSEAYKQIAKGAIPTDITSLEGMDSFCGHIRYEGIFTSDGYDGLLSLSKIGEAAEVWLNGKYLGASVSNPCEFPTGGALKKGENTLLIDVVNNLAYRDRDFFSTYMTLPASGFCGTVTLFHTNFKTKGDTQ